ncbi:hypothetical protein LZ30DRAFT_162687 [Colletotrichum cereale]|nr:hypothetical protein LZ30DRAFT_162687 [Colletotrichum cereale]
MRCEAYRRALWPASKPESGGTQSATSPVRPLTCLLRAAFLSEKTTGTNQHRRLMPAKSRRMRTTATTSASPAIACVSSIVIICNGRRACRNAYDSRATTVHRPCVCITMPCHAHPPGHPQRLVRRGIVRIGPGREKATSGATRDVMYAIQSLRRAPSTTPAGLGSPKARREGHTHARSAKCDSRRTRPRL